MCVQRGIPSLCSSAVRVITSEGLPQGVADGGFLALVVCFDLLGCVFTLSGLRDTVRSLRGGCGKFEPCRDVLLAEVAG